jgi:hypothetical protein
VTFVVTKRGKVPLGLRMQATGSAMSSGLSGANKGGYAMQAAQGRKPDKGKLVCVVCGSDKIAVGDGEGEDRRRCSTAGAERAVT